MKAIDLLRTRRSSVVLSDSAPSPAEPELILEAAVAAQNIMLAANALGYGAMWKTGASAYGFGIKRALELSGNDAIVGFIYAGTETRPPATIWKARAFDYVEYWPMPAQPSGA